MAQTVAVVRNTLTATGSGTTDFTSSGFGTPTAAIIIVCRANATNNPEASAEISIGFWDGTNQRAWSAHSGDGSGISVEGRASNDARGVIAGPQSTLNEYTVSAVTDGIRLTLSVDNTSLGRFCTVLLLNGVSSDLRTFTPNGTQDGTASVTGLAFTPSLVLFGCGGATTADMDTSQSIWSFGLAEVGGKHRMIAIGHLTAQDTTANTLLFSEIYCVGQTFNGAQTWAGEITTWAADGWTMTTRLGASGSDVCFALSLGGDLSFDCGTLTTPAATGNDAVTTTIQPDALLLALTTADSVDSLETTTFSDGLAIGLADGTNEYSHNFTTGDGIGTSNAQSVASAAAIVDLDEESGGFAAVADATVDSFNATDFTLNWSAVPATARKGFWLAFGASASGTVTATAACTIGGITCSATATFAPGTKTATAAPTIGGIQASASATHTAPSFTASAAPTIGGATAAAAGTFAEGTFTATAAPTVGGATCAIAATFVAPVFTASAAPSIGGVTAAISATHTAPVFTATAAPTIGGISAAIAATLATDTFTATIGVETGGATAAVSATFAPGTKTASAAPTIGGVTAAVSATFTPPSFTATVSVTCAAAIAAAAAEFAESVGLSPVDGFFAQERTRGFTADRRVRGFYATERNRGFVGSKS